MKDFHTVIKAQTDKSKLVRFAVDCVKRVVEPDDRRGLAALKVAEDWLDDPSAESTLRLEPSGKVNLNEVALKGGMDDEASTVVCGLAAFAAHTPDVSETAEYVIYITDDCLIASKDPQAEREWQILHFKELFPEI